MFGCGERIRIIAAITSPHQDDVIERVLKHLKIWAPPWKRARKTPGPPARYCDCGDPPSKGKSPRRVDRTLPDTDAYVVDPPWEDTS